MEGDRGMGWANQGKCETAVAERKHGNWERETDTNEAALKLKENRLKWKD